MAERTNDKYANMASNEVELVAGALDFSELLTGISLGQGMGIIIDQIDYYPGSNLIVDLDAANDTLEMAWTTSNAIDEINVNNRGVIHRASMTVQGSVDLSGQFFLTFPLNYQFFPPIIVAAPRIYLAVQGDAGLTGTLYSRLYFRYVKLTAQEYLELAESFVLVG